MSAAAPEPTVRSLAPHLARALVAQAQGGDTALLTATIERLYRERQDGHVCLRLFDLAGQARDVAEPGVAWPDSSTWLRTLAQSGLCNDGEPTHPPLPLVLDANARLYLRRDFAAERTIRDWLLRQRAPRPITAEAVAAAVRALGLQAPADGSIDWQLAAVVAAARASFLLLTGGPGTGKTTTVARLLGVLQHLEPGLRIAVAAPTGKAAARLGEALQQRADSHPALRALATAIVPTTLHRLLGYLPLDDAFRAGPERPLAHDVVVVDEASMVDPALLAVLCTALPTNARLVLVGDRDQLAAVAAGQVLGDLCRAARPERGVGANLAAFVQASTGMRLPVQTGAPPIADQVVALQVNHRFGAQPGIGAFAQALAARRPAAALAALQHGHPDLVFAADAEAAVQHLAPALLAAAAAAAAGDHAAALAALGSARVLTATRHGPQGAIAWNRRIEQLLAANGHRTDAAWYAGRPVLVTANDHQNRLWNGDLGVTIVDADGRPAVLFATGSGGSRLVPPLRLPAHETAWAMTVHKAQGSEFEQVLLVMPERPGPWWQASLLYTGITRARRRAVVLADANLLPPALGHWPARSSGLAEALADA